MLGYPTTDEFPEQIAAVDLGSNSFHMIVAQFDNGQIKVIDKLREMVRLGSGLTPDKRLDKEVEQRALECLSRFGQRLRALPPDAVRAVGTNTMRQLHDGGEFLCEAEKALGHNIEIIAGREEARLIYLGVANGLASGEDKRLVVDIGGGSTELILGQGMTPADRESLFMGCVSISRRFFPDGSVNEESMRKAVIACRLEIRPVRHVFNNQNWADSVGSSGTIKAIRNIVQSNGWCEQGITRGALKKLRKALVSAGHVDKVQLAELSDERRPVLAGGVAVLSAVFKSLDIDIMRVSDLALREGLLYEMVGIRQHHDSRDQTVHTLIRRYGLDTDHARRIEMTANALLSQVARDWDLTDTESAKMLGWAASLHEIGLIISHSSFHKHGAYILQNADLPGFSRPQQAVLSALVRGHRRKLPLTDFALLPQNTRIDTLRLCVLLRLAVLLHRGRSSTHKPMIYLDVDGNKIAVSFPEMWLEEHPLTNEEMATEAEYLKAADIELRHH